MMEQRANIEFCEIGQNIHRNISNVTEGLWGQSYEPHTKHQNSVWRSSEE